MNIGLMGGTFDPIHNGHLWIAEHAGREYGLDELWFIPAGDPYFKENSGVSPADIRLEMTRLCIRDTGKPYRVTDMEIRRKGKTYTSDTVSELKASYPEHTFYFIIGLDSLYQLDRWHEPSVLFNSAVILCAIRDEDDAEGAEKKISELKEMFPLSSCDIRLIHCSRVDISSTQIRNAVNSGRPISDLVTPSVESFIYKNRLYLNKIEG